MLGLERRGGHEPRGDHRRQYARGNVVERQADDVLAIHPFEFLGVEHGRFFEQAVFAEQLGHLRHGHDFAIAPRAPAHECEEVAHGFGENAEVLIVADGGRAVALGQLFAVEPVNHGKVREHGACGAQRLIEQNLLGRVGNVIVAAHHVRDAHEDVVTHHRQVVDGGAVGTENDEVFDVLVGEGDVFVHHVVPAGAAFRNSKANDERRAGSHARGNIIRTQAVATAIVLEGIFAGLGFFAPLVEFGCRAEAAVGVSALQHRPSVALMPLEKRLRALVHHLFVPRET